MQEMIAQPTAINLFNVALAHNETVKNINRADYKFYNSLPLVSDSAKQAEQLATVRNGLLTIVQKHGLGDVVSVRLIHKHFDMNPGELATFTTISVPGICKAITMGPIKPGPDIKLLGKNFMLDPSGNWIAFEFTTDMSFGGHVNLFPAFSKEAAEYLMKNEGHTVFGLSWEPTTEDSQHFTEFEIADKRTTVMVPSELFPGDKTEEIIQTNWSLTPERDSDCLKTRHNHYGCKLTRSNTHYGARSLVAKYTKEGGVPEPHPEDAPFWKALQDPTTDFFKVVAHVTAFM